MHPYFRLFLAEHDITERIRLSMSRTHLSVEKQLNCVSKVDFLSSITMQWKIQCHKQQNPDLYEHWIKQKCYPISLISPD